YDFSTVVDDHVVDADPEGLQIGVGQNPVGGASGSGSGDGTGGGPDGGGSGHRGGGDPVNGGGGGGGGAAPGGRPGRGGGGSGTPIWGGPAAAGGGPGTPAIDAGALERPIPNPFRDGMHMAYAVSDGGQRVEIAVFDLAGRRVRTLASGVESPGRHDVAWDGR